MSKKVAIPMVVLIVLLVLAVGYIAFDKYSGWKQNQEYSIYQEGAQLGYEQAIAQLYQGAISCQQVPVTYDNQTINLVAVECLQQAQAPATG